MSDTGIRFEAQIAVRTPEQQGEECRRAYEETERPAPRRITAEPPGWEGTRALHERHVAALRPTIAPQNLDLANAIYGYAVANASLFDQRQLAALHVVEDTLRGEYGVSQ
jgi:hypothetical protein